MAGKGPPPKPPEKKTGHHKPEQQTELGAPVAKAPALPRAATFSKETRAWYRTWAATPMSAQFSTTEWQRLHMLAPLVDRYFKEPSAALFAEIRRTESALGATSEDRLRLRWRFSESKKATERADKAQDKAAPAQRKRTDPRLKLVEGNG